MLSSIHDVGLMSQVNDHGVWLPGTVQAKQEDTWGTEIFVVGFAATHVGH